MMLACVNPEEIGQYWPVVRHFIASAVDKTGLADFAEMEAQILAGDQLVWLAIEDDAIRAVASTHLSLIGGNKVCTLTACAGHGMKEWLPLFEKIEQYAKNEECGAFRIYGRKGWQRMLEGYSAKHVILEKRL